MSCLLRALRRAINALNMATSFKTDEGISSYTLIPQLEQAIHDHTISNTENLVSRSLQMFIDELKDNATKDDDVLNPNVALQGRILEKYRDYLQMGYHWVQALLLTPTLPIDDVAHAKRITRDILTNANVMIPSTATAIVQMKRILSITNGEYDFAMRALGETVQNDPPGT